MQGPLGLCPHPICSHGGGGREQLCSPKRNSICTVPGEKGWEHWLAGNVGHGEEGPIVTGTCGPAGQVGDS